MHNFIREHHGRVGQGDDGDRTLFKYLDIRSINCWTRAFKPFKYLDLKSKRKEKENETGTFKEILLTLGVVYRNAKSIEERLQSFCYNFPKPFTVAVLL